jgi:hypothetical protein
MVFLMLKLKSGKAQNKEKNEARTSKWHNANRFSKMLKEKNRVQNATAAG